MVTKQSHLHSLVIILAQRFRVLNSLDFMSLVSLKATFLNAILTSEQSIVSKKSKRVTLLQWIKKMIHYPMETIHSEILKFIV